MDDDLLYFAVPEIDEPISKRKKFKTAAKTLGTQTLKAQLHCASRKRKGAIGGKRLRTGVRQAE